ncbi:hypothetical protein QFC21_002108 [Naganishia friedmannii]|uniref:Uncharacterized protein n=1 Tax=Naganishia friedmannii TaxID=89922 RepID=A0ACC2W0F4_9TREE|nr:hypothetical protein QFC21_002108 [Naganishia friedmannii]
MAALAYVYDSRSAVHEHVAMPVLRTLTDAETSHKLAVKMLAMSSWVRPKDRGIDAESIRTELFGLPLNNPVGLAAGFDKDAQAVDGLFDLGFAYVEVGSVTPEPQPGNPQPRFFRLEEDQACINRYGFNSLGHRHALHQLQSRIRNFALDHPSLFPNPLPLNPLPPSSLPRSLRPGCLLAVNLGKNKSSSTASHADYVTGVRLLGPYADVLVINVSSPNTPGLRGLQGKSFLTKLLQDVVQERDLLPVPQALKPKVVVKIAPDLDEQEIEDIADSIRSSGVDGAIVSNTTVKRAALGLQSVHAAETGGLSGKPVKSLSLLTLSALRALLPTSIPIIGCGGISTGDDAVDFLNAGADMVQAYTAFGYSGVGFARKVKDEIAANLEQQSTTWKAEVAKNRRKWVESADHLEQQLKAEVSRLKQAMDDAPSLVPVEDLAAAAGQDCDDLSATREDSSRTFGSMKAIAQQTHTDSEPTASTAMHKLGASLHPFVSAVLGVSGHLPGLQDELPHADVACQSALETPPLESASASRIEDLSWRESVNQGDRRLV